jgi:predicted outer membrane repeat protein
MQGGTISGNTATYYGGGVYGDNITKTGGTIYGDDAEQKLKNTVISGIGHALYTGRNKNWRNAGAGPTMNTESYGFWLSEGDFVLFPSGFEGTRKRSNFNNTLTIDANIIKSSSSNYVWILQRISGNSYTLKRADASNTMTLTIRLDGDNLIISGDSGSGENNWNGTWLKW